MLKVGITGGIGSGKTTVCRLFECLGVPVYYADDRAKTLLDTVPEIRLELEKLFGTTLYDADGKLIRSALAQLIFHDEARRNQVEAIVHPQVAVDAQRWMRAQADHPYVLKEAALLVESGSYKQLDRLVVVTAPEALRIQRVIDRDGTSREEVEARIGAQLAEADKAALADHRIDNSGSTYLIPQVMRLHRTFAAAKAR